MALIGSTQNSQVRKSPFPATCPTEMAPTIISLAHCTRFCISLVHPELVGLVHTNTRIFIYSTGMDDLKILNSYLPEKKVARAFHVRGEAL